MIILIEGKPALLKSGSSLEFIAENRLFMGRDSYTLSLTFPLRDCPQNRDIFGNIERIDVAKEKLSYGCVMQDRSFSAVGSLLVVGVSETEVKCQFAQGRCEQSAKDPFEDTYVNLLDLGLPPSERSFTPMQAWAGLDGGMSEVALPWVNESYPAQFNNWVACDGVYMWAHGDDLSTNSSRLNGAVGTLRGEHLSWQPYLIEIARRICAAVDYTCDFEEWEHSGYRYLIICNTLPASWHAGYADALPHWTVSEFFEKLELFLMCEFDFDHVARHVVFHFSKTVLDSIPPVCLTHVVDEYTADITAEKPSCSYIGGKRLAYKECSHPMQPYYACDWFIDGKAPYVYSNVNEFLEKCKKRTVIHGAITTDVYGEDIEPAGYRQPDSNVGFLIYAQAEKTHFVIRSIGRYLSHVDKAGYNRYNQVCVPQPVNVFGSGCVESDDVENEDIEFVPACVSDTYVSDDDDQGCMLFLSFSSNDTAAADTTRVDFSDKDYGNKIVQFRAAADIEAGQAEKKNEYYDVIYVGLWDGTIPDYGYTPYPMVDTVNVTQRWTSFQNHLPDLRLTSHNRNVQFQIPMVDPKRKCTFSFISDTIPNPRAVFFIHGCRYVCEKITATFTEDGMSQLLKGEFYPIV